MLRPCFVRLSCDIWDTFFLYFQRITKTKLIRDDAMVIFDEIQRFPRAREAIKHLVADGRFHYLETGSLISINKNVKDIVIPSEERHLDCFAGQVSAQICEIPGGVFRAARERPGADRQRDPVARLHGVAPGQGRLADTRAVYVRGRRSGRPLAP